MRGFLLVFWFCWKWDACAKSVIWQDFCLFSFISIVSWSVLLYLGYIAFQFFLLKNLHVSADMRLFLNRYGDSRTFYVSVFPTLSRPFKKSKLKKKAKTKKRCKILLKNPKTGTTGEVVLQDDWYFTQIIFENTSKQGSFFLVSHDGNPTYKIKFISIIQ